MKSGIANTHYFSLRENSPILLLKGSNISESDRMLVKGTVIEGALKTRLISIDGTKAPFKLIQMSGEKNAYLSPEVVNLYAGDFSNTTGRAKRTSVKSTAVGETKGSKRKNFIINYALPIAGGVIGYKIAKKQGATTKKLVLYTLGFALLASIPRYLNK